MVTIFSKEVLQGVDMIYILWTLQRYLASLLKATTLLGAALPDVTAPLTASIGSIDM